MKKETTLNKEEILELIEKVLEENPKEKTAIENTPELRERIVTLLLESRMAFKGLNDQEIGKIVHHLLSFILTGYYI